MSYAIRDVFLTLQGEGARAGAKSVFVRFAGCNLWTGRPEDRAKGTGACAQWCDTDFFRGAKMEAGALEERMAQLWRADEKGPRWCVLTGGEPMLQVDQPLLLHLVTSGWKVAVETNGSVEIPRQLMGFISWLTVSPKLGAPLVVQRSNEVKAVLPGMRLGGWPWEALVAMEAMAPLRFVQPQDPIDQAGVDLSFLGGKAPRLAEEYSANLKACQDFVMAHPGWKVSLQTHKLMGVP